MSRLRALQIPFAQGHDDSKASEVLPDGTFADVRNGRLNKLGQLQLRRGWRPLAMLALDGTTIVAHDLYSHGQTLVALCSHLSLGARFFHLATFTNSVATNPWSVSLATNLPPATNARLVGNAPPLDS